MIAITKSIIKTSSSSEFATIPKVFATWHIPHMDGK
jgi:hypothetical protein